MERLEERGDEKELVQENGKEIVTPFDKRKLLSMERLLPQHVNRHK